MNNIPHNVRRLLRDPLGFQRVMWPDVKFYDKQEESVRSVRDNDETVIVAGNQLGKDFLAGYVALSFFLHPQMYFPKEYVREVNSRVKPGVNPLHVHTRRVITTSVAEKHLNVLWGEIGRYVSTCRFPLMHRQGGPLVVNSMEVRFADEMDVKTPVNYLRGQVSEKGEGMAGHHAAYTLMVVDEASGSEDQVKDQADGWAKKYLIFGNPNPTNNFFYRAVKGGDVMSPVTVEAA